MGLFDNLKNKVAQSISDGISNTLTNKSEKIVFTELPDTFEEFKNLPQAQLQSPYETAALTVVALCFYPESSEKCIQMLEYLRGPRPLSEYDKQFLRDRFLDKDYIPRSYFNGTSPQNDYMPTEPYTITVSANAYSQEEENLVKLFIKSSGADSPRPIQLRKAKDGKWYLWEQFLLSGIREPESRNPWA